MGCELRAACNYKNMDKNEIPFELFWIFVRWNKTCNSFWISCVLYSKLCIGFVQSSEWGVYLITYHRVFYIIICTHMRTINTGKCLIKWKESDISNGNRTVDWWKCFHSDQFLRLNFEWNICPPQKMVIIVEHWNSQCLVWFEACAFKWFLLIFFSFWAILFVFFFLNGIVFCYPPIVLS